jgi:hypothetical protein
MKMNLLDRLDLAIKELQSIRDELDDQQLGDNRSDRWTDDIDTVIRDGRTHSLDNLYRAVKKVRKAAGRSWTVKSKATIRNTLGIHDPQSKHFIGPARYERVRRGVWKAI